MVDAVIAAHKLSLTGPDTVSILAFEHPGFVLYSIEPAEAESALEQLQNLSSTNQDAAAAAGCGSSSGTEIRKLQTLAAFVAQELVDGNDGGSSSSDAEE